MAKGHPKGEGHGWPEFILPGAPDIKRVTARWPFFVSGSPGGR